MLSHSQPDANQVAARLHKPKVTNAEPESNALIEQYGRLPLSFEANVGDENGVRFTSRGHGFGFYLMRNRAVLLLASRGSEQNDADDRAGRNYQTLTLRYVDSNKNPRITALKRLPGAANYFIGNDPSKWRTNVPLYSAVKYEDVYPGIDVVYHGDNRALEYDFVVQPGQSPRRIKTEFESADEISIEENGDLLIRSGTSDLRQRKPIAYQEIHGERREVDVRYRLDGNGIRFEVGRYDRTQPLIIDPMFVYSTFLGGSGSESGLGIAVDSQGSAYVTGVTTSTDFPLASPFQGVKGSVDDAFVVKLSPSGNALVYSTYIGGNGSDNANAIAVDSQGNAYIAGFTGSGSFPITAGAFQTSKSGFIDGFVTKLNAAGSTLLYSTYVGGDNSDTIFGIAVDANQRAYIVGRSDSTQLNFFPFPRHGSPVYKSSDSAANWSPSATDLTASSVNAFAIDPATSNTIYAGGITGVFKSTDAGGHWSLTGTTRPSTAPLNVNAVVVDPTDSSLVYAGAASGVYKSTNGGSLYDQKTSGFANIPVNALAIDPAAPTTLYAGTVLGIYKSTNGADTWTEIKNGITGSSPRVNEIAIDPTNPSTIYIGTNRGMFKTTNGGALWAAINSGPMSNPIPQITALAIDPLTPSTLYAAGQFSSQVLFKSTDGGSTWSGSSTGLTYSVGGQSFLPTVNMLAIDPLSPATLYAATSGGAMYKSVDSGANWSQANAGLANTTLNAVAVDGINPAIVYAGTNIGSDAFIVRLNPSGSALEYLLNLGGDEFDEARGVTVDSNNNAYVVGATNSPNFPVQNAYQSTFAGFSDAFVTKVNAAGSGFVYSTFLGGTGGDAGRAIAVRADRAYITGLTTSANFPLASPIKSTLAEFDLDGFVSGFNPAGSALDFSTYLGGESSDQAVGIAVDNSGIYVTGSTSSLLFPVSDAPQSQLGGSNDAFVTKLNSAGTSIVYSTYLGGASNDVGNGIAIDSSGNAYVVGNTPSSDFPTVNPFQSTLTSTDAFITKIGIDADLSITKTESRDPVLVNSPFNYRLTINNNGPSAATGVTVVDTLPAGLTLNSAAPIQGSCSVNSSTLTCNLGPVAAGAGAIIIVSVMPTATGVITNTATVTGNEPDANSANNTATETTKISSSPSIRGFVKDANNIGVSGVLMTLTGTQAATVQTDSAGFYQFAELPLGGNYVITPSKANFSIDPESMTFNSLNVDRSADFVASVCTYGIAPAVQSFSASGGTGVVSVASLHGCPWTAATSASWLTITSGASGVGSGTVNFSVSPTTIPRAAHLTINGLNFAVYQEFDACGPAFDIGSYSVSLVSPNIVRATDLDLDGDIDLVLGNKGNSGAGIPASVMLNNGMGVFSTSTFDTGIGTPQDFVVADLNGDSKADIAMTSYNFPFVRIFFNNGAGGFGQNNADIPFTSQGQSPLTGSLFKADVNKDGKADLLVSTPGTNGIQVLIGNGNGTFTQGSPIGFTNLFGLIQVADVNNDGTDDLVLGAGGSAGPLGVMLGNGSGGFGAAIISTGINSATVIIATGDFDGDGNIDLVLPTTVQPSSLQVFAVMSGDGAGHFTRKSTVSAPSSGTAGITAGDFNRDGKTDVAYTSGSTRVTVLLGSGVGGLGTAIEMNTGGNEQFPGNAGIVAADLNGDGRPDLGVANYTLGAKVLLNNCAALQLLLDSSGPSLNQAAAVDSLLLVRDPFRVPNSATWWNLGSDLNTRVTILALNLILNPGETASAVTVNLVDASGQSRDLAAEDVRAVPNSNFIQITFRLPDNIASGQCTVAVKAHNSTSNVGTFRIAP